MRSWIPGSLLLLPVAGSLLAGTVFPLGGQVGTSLELRWFPDGEEEAQALLFSDPRLRARPVFQEANRIWPEAWRKPNRFRLDIPDDLEPGRYEVRAVYGTAFSNPVAFLIPSSEGMPEVNGEPEGRDARGAIPVEFGQWINGLVQGGEVDRFQLHANRGERILVELKGGEIASGRRYPLLWISNWLEERVPARAGLAGEPIRLDVSLAETGVYDLNVLSQAVSAGEVQSYRIRAFRSPWIDGVTPLVGKAGERQPVEIWGRNLAGDPAGPAKEFRGIPYEKHERSVRFPSRSRERAQPVKWFRAEAEDGVFLDLGAADDPIPEREGEKTATLSVPATVSGAFDFPGDSDSFRFRAEAERWLQVEVAARHRGLGRRPRLVVQRVMPGKWEHEDFRVVQHPSVPWGWSGGHAVVGREIKVEEPGEYVVVVAEQSGHPGPGHDYALTIRRSRPGFRLFAESRPPVLRAGTRSALRMAIRRTGGFKGAVRLEAEGLPEGVSSEPAVLWEGAGEGLLVFQASEESPNWQGWIDVVGWSLGSAKVDRGRAVDEATGGKTPCAVRGSTGDPGLLVEVEDPRETEAGERELPFRVRRGAEAEDEPVRVTLMGAPGVVQEESRILPAGDTDGVLPLTPVETAAGEGGEPRSGTLVIRAEMEVQVPNEVGKIQLWSRWRDRIETTRSRLENELEEANRAVDRAEAAWAKALRSQAEAERRDRFWETRKARIALDRAVTALETRRQEVREARRWLEKSWKAEERVARWLEEAAGEGERRTVTRRAWSAPVRIEITLPAGRRKPAEKSE